MTSQLLSLTPASPATQALPPDFYPRAALEARRLVGTPYRHQGRGKWGVDCVGLVLAAYKNAEVDLSGYDQRGYSDRPSGGALERALDRVLVQVPGPERSGSDPGQESYAQVAGRVGLFRFAHEPQHVGLLTAEGTVVHAYSGVGRVVEHALDEKWLRRLVAIYEIRERSEQE